MQKGFEVVKSNHWHIEGKYQCRDKGDNEDKNAAAKWTFFGTVIAALITGVVTLIVAGKIPFLNTQIDSTQTATSNEASAPQFTAISIKPIVNHKNDGFTTPPSGSYDFKGIPFTLLSDSKDIFHTQDEQFYSLPKSGSLEVNISHPINIYILLSGGWVHKSFMKQIVGMIRLYFLDGSQTTYNIVVGQNIRESWAYDNTSDYDAVTELIETSNWMNVYSESQYRGDESAKAFIDMTQIDIPAQYQTSVLTKIDIVDSSLENNNMISPSLIVYGITVKAIP
ncbi:MAG: hypothetical protein U0Z26_09230 [Anaerolineales bacterium]